MKPICCICGGHAQIGIYDKHGEVPKENRYCIFCFIQEARELRERKEGQEKMN